MDYEINYNEFVTDPEIRMYRYGDMPTRIVTLDNSSVTADKNGQKIVPIGTLVDKDGRVCKLSADGITGTPIGITHDTKNVTKKNKAVACFVRGHIKGPMLNFEGEQYDDAMGKAVQEALPEIHIYPIPAEEE